MSLSCDCVIVRVISSLQILAFSLLLLSCLKSSVNKNQLNNDAAALWIFFPAMIPQAMRLFVGEPVWTPYNRPHDHLPARYDPASEA